MNPSRLGVFAAISSFALGCMPDAELAQREAATQRLRGEARLLERHVAQMERHRDKLEGYIAAGRSMEGAVGLIQELKDCGLAVRKGEGGTLRLFLASELGTRVPLDWKPEPLSELDASRLAHAGTVIRQWLPEHAVTVQARDFARAVETVRIMNEQSGVIGARLSAVTGQSARLMVEVRPAGTETLQEALAALPDY